MDKQANTIPVTADTLRRIFAIARSGNSFFSVRFVKRDGSLRKMTIRPRTGSGLRGGSRAWDPKLYRSRFVAEVIRGSVQWRTVNLSTLRSVSWQGYQFELATDRPPVPFHALGGAK